MATRNPLPLPIKGSLNRYAIPGLPLVWASGNNRFRSRATKLLYTGAGEVYGDRILPESLDTAQAVKAVALLATPTAGSAGQKIRLELGYSSIAATESADPSAAQRTVSVSADVSAWTAKTARAVEFTLTAADLAALDHFVYALKRDPSHTDDNHDVDVWLLSLYLWAYY